MRGSRRRKILYFSGTIFTKAGIIAAAIFLFLSVPIVSSSQISPDHDSVENKETLPHDSKEQERSATARVSLSYHVLNLDLRDRKFTERTIRYLRDAELYAGAYVYYGGFGLGSRVGVADPNNPGHKKIEDYYLTAKYFSRAFGVEIFYDRFSRFSISGSPYGIGKQWNESRRGSRMKSESACLDLHLFLEDILTLNKNYSYSAAFDQSEKQGKSGGTFFLKLGGDYNRMRNNRLLLPFFAHELLMHLYLYGFKGWMFAGFNFGVGFAYTIVLPADFFISTYISLMVRPMHKEFFTFIGTKREFRIDSLKGKGKISLGYNGGTFFMGMGLTYEGIITPSYRFKAEMWSGDLAAEFFSGARF